MILCDRDIKAYGRAGHLVIPYDEKLVNPASYDIRVGLNLMQEGSGGGWKKIYIGDLKENHPYWLGPGDFVLIETLETLTVPNGFAMECKLKSSLARQGLNHSLAFWFDPGWYGVGTLEISNVSKQQRIPIWYGMPIVQCIWHRLTGDAERPYQGRYQDATGVELAKEPK